MSYRLLAVFLIATAGLLGQPGAGPENRPGRLVTDEVAYTHLFAITARTNAPESPEAFATRREAFCQHVGLDEEQGAILLEIADRYQRYMTDLNARAERRVGPAVLAVEGTLTDRQRATLRAIASGRRGKLLGLISELHARLDDQGDLLVKRFVDEQVRPRVEFR